MYLFQGYQQLNLAYTCEYYKNYLIFPNILHRNITQAYQDMTPSHMRNQWRTTSVKTAAIK